jgi:hypothetical protein
MRDLDISVTTFGISLHLIALPWVSTGKTSNTIHILIINFLIYSCPNITDTAMMYLSEDLRHLTSLESLTLDFFE